MEWWKDIVKEGVLPQRGKGRKIKSAKEEYEGLNSLGIRTSVARKDGEGM